MAANPVRIHGWFSICAFFLVLVGISPDPSRAEAALPAPGSATAFHDCPADQGCPAMVVIPGSDQPVRLGAPAGETGRIDNEVEHERTIAAFAIGATEVSVAQYRRCVDEGGCRPPEWLEPGGEHNVETGRGVYYKNLGTAVTAPDAPIVGVSFDDATAFSQWLAKKTGKPYRLPSEAEWEYAARAGTTTAYWWGNEADAPDGSARGNCRGCGTAERKLAPDPVTAFAPNAWGLYNVHGNVWEWVADYYCNDQSSGPKDGSPRAADDCPVRDAPNLRVFRGGSAFYTPDKMRSASRLRNFPGFRNFSVGFRIARNL
jgi:formylglycine-generating enzyme required for sulfatase activity